MIPARDTAEGPRSTPPPRHHATAKAWEWFETDERALGYAETLRASIEAKLEDLDAELLAWDKEADRGE